MEDPNMKRALIIGRFQPFHLGHIKIIEEISRACDEIIIGIGSSQESHTIKNPFTAGERIMMIKNSLDSSYSNLNKKINYLIIPISDVNNNSIWVSHVSSLVPKFHVVYSGNNLVKRLFKEAGFLVMEQKNYDRHEYSGTEIRERIIKGIEWEYLVPNSVVEIINEISGVERIRELAVVSVLH